MTKKLEGERTAQVVEHNEKQDSRLVGYEWQWDATVDVGMTD